MYEVYDKILSLRHIQKITPGVECGYDMQTVWNTPSKFKRIIATVLDHDGVVMPRAVVCSISLLVARKYLYELCVMQNKGTPVLSY